MTSSGKSGLPWKGLLVLFLLVALVYWLFLAGPSQQPGDTASADAAENAEQEPQAAQVSPFPATDAGIAAAPTLTPAPKPASTPPALTAAQAAPQPITQTVQSHSAPMTTTTAPVTQPTTPAPAPLPTPIAQANPAAPVPAAPTVANSSIARQVSDALKTADAGNAIKARAQLSRMLFDTANLSIEDETLLRRSLDDMNAELLFSRKVATNDPATLAYQVQPGDRLINIANRYKVPYQFLELINNTDARRLQVGQNIKLVRGPIHARVSKTRFVLDMYVIGSDGAPVYLTSFPVGLGENDGTPVGKWKIGNAKVTNPDWRNPRTGEYFTADNPQNPIGEYWIPMDGLEGNAVGRTGFGIHGTIDPDSIGKMKSMGCIRLADADIAMVYNMLFANESTVDVLE